MKKIIIALLVLSVFAITLASCSCEGMTGNSESTDTQKKETTDTRESAGSITETGTDTNIVDRVESMVGMTDTTTDTNR